MYSYCTSKPAVWEQSALMGWYSKVIKIRFSGLSKITSMPSYSSEYMLHKHFIHRLRSQDIHRSISSYWAWKEDIKEGFEAHSVDFNWLQKTYKWFCEIITGNLFLSVYTRQIELFYCICYFCSFNMFVWKKSLF